MTMDRRRFLASSGAAVAGGVLGARTWDAAAAEPSAPSAPFDPSDWRSVREQFAIAEELVDLTALYLSSHPAPVRDAIANHRRALDRDPARYLRRNDGPLTDATLEAAARYSGADLGDLALVDSTTMGLGLLYTGLALHAGQEALTTEHDYYVTHEALRLAAARTGATVRKIPLFEDSPDGLDPDGIVETIAGSIRPETRVLALTWVHSGTGLELPLAEIARAVREIDESRPEPDRVLLCVDGVHGFGVEDVTLGETGFDFFVAGCHKWLFGPRGTGLLWGRGESWRHVRPTVPSFLSDNTWSAWLRGTEPRGHTTGRRMSPGGFKPFEHRWALAEAFGFLEGIGKARVAERTHALARRLKEGLAAIPGVELVTPMSEELSAGIVCFDVAGLTAGSVVRRLDDRGVVATVTPYAVRHVRMAPSIRNTPEEIDTALATVEELAR